MENLLLSPVEQQLVLKSKKFLEHKYNVKIFLPDYVSLCEHDVVVATIHGAKINLVKNFIQRRMVQMKHRQEQRITVQNNVTTITLSDSDCDSSTPALMETQQKGKKRTRRRKKRCSANKESNELVDMSSTVLVEDSGESANEDVPKRPKEELPSPVDFIPLRAEKENNVKCVEIDGERDLSKVKFESSVSSANLMLMDNAQINGNICKDDAEVTIILSDSPPPSPPGFISLSSGKEKGSTLNGIDDSIIIIEDEIPKPIVNEPKCLRPIVIDGSNVAREHGKVSNTFSCKGIKIAIDYFIQRGHKQVTAFVPHYRRHNKFGPVLTTDQPLLEELAKEQLVVFTPSRRIDNKRVTCYDDRFIVELATQTGGVILSNDNYRDLAAEREEFKKTVNERLLMFCFVGDIIMIPQDPLGRDGPSLENFLSFPS